MITTVLCFINGFILMFGGEGFIKNFDAAFCCAMLELIITIGVIGIVSALKGFRP
jgi:hypothetical protein